LKPYTLILVTAPIAPELLSKLSANAATSAIPTFYIHCTGFYSHFSIHIPSAFPIVDTHPDPETTTDLRLLTPWPELSQFTVEKTSGLVDMNHHDHGHVPYVCLLLHYLEEWKKEHDGQVPQNYKEKTEFRQMVSQGARTDTPEGGEENYDEAAAAVLKSLNPATVKSAVKEVFEAPECKLLTAETPNFWLIANAIWSFYVANDALPLPGSVPDMKSRSADYIQLQNVYKSKARQDLAEVLQRVRDLEKKLGRTKAIEEKEVEASCKNASHIKLVRGRPFHIVFPGKGVKWEDRAKAAGILLRAVIQKIYLHRLQPKILQIPNL
jgi:amyloid beta precursor protein binding protein 1